MTNMDAIQFEIKLFMGNIFRILFGNFNGRKNLEDIDKEGRIILK
jgi:hypothetical protein